MARIWLLASCVFLCFLAADAVICRQCNTMRPWIPCLPLRSKCAAIKNKMVCINTKIYKGFQLWQQLLGCTSVDDHKCDEWYYDKVNDKLYTYACCSNKDYCTQDL